MCLPSSPRLSPPAHAPCRPSTDRHDRQPPPPPPATTTPSAAAGARGRLRHLLCRALQPPGPGGLPVRRAPPERGHHPPPARPHRGWPPGNAGTRPHLGAHVYSSPIPPHQRLPCLLCTRTPARKVAASPACPQLLLWPSHKLAQSRAAAGLHRPAIHLPPPPPSLLAPAQAAWMSWVAAQRKRRGEVQGAAVNEEAAAAAAAEVAAEAQAPAMASAASGRARAE